MGRNQGHNLPLKIKLQILIFRRVQAGHGELLHPFFGELAHELVVAGVLPGQEVAHLLINGLELLLGGHTGAGIHRFFVGNGLVEQTPHPHHKKLIQIALEDGHEFQPLIPGHPMVFALFQHPLIELQPAQFPVGVPRGGLFLLALGLFFHVVTSSLSQMISFQPVFPFQV